MISSRIDNIYRRILYKRQGKIEETARSIVLTKDKPVYYVIRRRNNGDGFFSNYKWVLGHAIYAIEKDMIPVVDMFNWPSLYSKGAFRNDWNDYFEDPVGSHGLREAYSSRNFVLAEPEYLVDYSDKYSIQYGFPSEKAVDYYSPYIKKYFRIRKGLEDEFSRKRQLICDTAQKVIGVHYRGTDMKRGDIPEHPKTKEIDRYIRETEEIINKEGNSLIYLATDENEAVRVFNDVFGKGQVCVQDSYRADKGQTNGIHLDKSVKSRKDHNYLLGIEVMFDAWMLAKCDNLVCGLSNVASVARLWNDNKFENVKVII